MAEEVEEPITERESLFKTLFGEKDIEFIVTLRTEILRKIKAVEVGKDDIILYAAQEMQLLKGATAKHRKMETLPRAPLNDLEMAIANRLNRILDFGVRILPYDKQMWITYLKFCRCFKVHRLMSKLLSEMFEVHQNFSTDIYELAADWEYSECKSVENARKHLQKGLSVHKDDSTLLKKAFCIELEEAARLRKDCKDKNTPIDPANPDFTTKKAECIFECMKNIQDVEYFNDLLKTCEQYDFTNDLKNQIYSLVVQFETSERVYDILARKELALSPTEKVTKEKIRKCVEVYDVATSKLNTPLMWTFYVKTLVELQKDTSVLTKYKTKLLMATFSKGLFQQKLTEESILTWVSLLLLEEDKVNKLVEVLEEATRQLPQSLRLWYELMNTHVTRKFDREQGYVVLDQATEAMGKEALPLWKFMHIFERTGFNSKVEELYEKGVRQCPEISNPMKVFYVEYLGICVDIETARQVYLRLVDVPPPCLDLHKKIIQLERCQVIPDKPAVRSHFTRACAEFGKENIALWIDYCLFEERRGDKDRVSEVYRQARETLNPDLVETFVAKFQEVTWKPPDVVEEDSESDELPSVSSSP